MKGGATMTAYERIDVLLDDLFKLEFEDKNVRENYNTALKLFNELYERTVWELNICIKRTCVEDEYYRFDAEREEALELLATYLEIVFEYFEKESINGKKRD